MENTSDDLEQFRTNMRKVGESRQDLTKKVPQGMTATREWLAATGKAWITMSEGLAEHNAASIDRLFMSHIDQATMAALINIEERLIALETKEADS